MRIAVVLVLSVVTVCRAATPQLRFAWKQMEYAWDSPTDRDNAIAEGKFVQENNLPLGLARWKNKLFITVPKWKNGVASTLNYVDVDGPTAQPLKPYPSWKDNLLADSLKELPSNSSLACVFRVFVDACDRLWVMDSGLVDIWGHPKALTEEEEIKIIKAITASADFGYPLLKLDLRLMGHQYLERAGKASIFKGKPPGETWDIVQTGSPNQIAGPSLVIFDLNTDALLHRYFFKVDDMKEDSFFANVIVDVDKDSCDDAYAYVPDLGAYGVVVYSLKKDDSWRVAHHYFHFEPLAGAYMVGGVQFHWTDGVFALALSEPKEHGYRTLFFHALSSTKEFCVSTELLRNYTLINKEEAFYDFKLLGDRGEKTQSSASYYDPKTNVLFYTQVNRDGVACWNTGKPYAADTNPLIFSDPTLFEFPNDLKVDSEGTLWVLSDRMPRFLYKSLDPEDINYRILSISTSEAIAGTACA